MKILIIEDEVNTAKELERILHRIDPSISVLSILDNVKDSITFLSENIPDLIFSDIQLADGICFDIYNEVKVTSPIIFCTAYDDFMLDAFDTNAVSYLLKPITEKMVSKALEKYQSFKLIFEPEMASLSVQKLAKQLKYAYKTSLLVEQREKIIPLPVKKIAYIYLENTVVKVATKKNQKYVLSASLEELEKILDPEMFYRANRQFIINRSAIVNIERYFSRKLITKLNVETPETIVISKAKASDFLKWMES